MKQKPFFWPCKDDKAFKEIKDGETLGPNIANIDVWIKEQGCSVLLPDAYKEAADMIVSCIEEGKISKKPDMYFFPVAFLYRHSIELELKWLLQSGIQLRIYTTKDVEKIMGEHELYPLWGKVRSMLEGFEKNEVYSVVESQIREFDNLDKSGQAFRYSEDKKGKSTTEKLPPTIDLLNLKKVCDGLFSFFDACDCQLSEV